MAILVGAGRGERLGSGIPKAFVPLAGEPLLARSARVFEAAASVDAIIAVVPEERVPEAGRLLAPMRKLRAVTAGGARRQDSVQAGLSLLAAEHDGIVLVHDAARPFVEPALIDAVTEAAGRTGAAIPVLAVADTIKRVSEGHIASTEDRRLLAAAQTPQAFRCRALRAAYAAATREGVELTDEAMALERMGLPVAAVMGSPRNRKVTTPDDLAWAESVLAAGDPGGGVRVGTGFDMHRLVEGRPLMLGGVHIDHPRGLLGHSDGDCVVHAVCDALLGAAAAGDMGRHFPSSDARWRDAPSLSFLQEVVRIVADSGHDVGNVDVTVIAEQPRLAGHVEAMRAALSRCLGRPLAAVSVKVKSADGLGPIGAGEGIAAQAAVVLAARPR